MMNLQLVLRWLPICFSFTSGESLFLYNSSYEPDGIPQTSLEFKDQLPKDFLFGYASASTQVEGAVMDDGRSLSIWDRFAALDGKIDDGSNPSITNDEYHLINETIDMLKASGANLYRFSIAWPRIIPGGFKGSEISKDAIKHYNVLIDALIQNGITPFVTLYHWDMPDILQHTYRGFLDEERFSTDFLYFASTCFAAFGDRVKHWITFNEPMSYCLMGYSIGIQAPGGCSNPFDCVRGVIKLDLFQCVHTTILVHARTVAYYRQVHQNNQKGIISIALNAEWSQPMDPLSPVDIEAAQLAMDFMFGWIADPIYLTGDYPESFKKHFRWILPRFSEMEKLMIKGSADFFGINHYTSNFVTGPKTKLTNYNNFKANWFPFAFQLTFSRNGQLIGAQGGNEWLYDVPMGFKSLLEYITSRYNNPEIYVTENGFAVRGEPEFDLKTIINDRARISYYKGYLEAMLLAIRDSGVTVKGYISWTLMDNWEWSAGFTNRFGVAYVERPSQKRIFKNSAYYLRSFFSHAIMGK